MITNFGQKFCPFLLLISYQIFVKIREEIMSTDKKMIPNFEKKVKFRWDKIA